MSDVSIVNESNILIELVEPGDDIMTAEHLLFLKHAWTVNIPAFSHGKQLSKKIFYIYSAQLYSNLTGLGNIFSWYK